jgi:TPR repeat protein
MRGCENAVAWDTARAPLERAGVAALVALSLFGASASFALDSGSSADPNQKIHPETFASPRDALKKGFVDLQNGDAESSVVALQYAAEGGELLADWKLGNLYAKGDLVQRDDALAYKYFEKIVESYNGDDADRRDAGAIANAFVAVGLYSLNGIANSEVRADPERALAMFSVAASDFGSPEAQYRLGRMYMEGAPGLAHDPRNAVRWFALAAEKGHCGAQALLGHMLFNGEGVPRQKARGLMWLMFAAKGAKGPADAWIREQYAKDSAAASEDDREIALAYVNSHQKEGEIPRAGDWRVISPPMRLPSAAPPLPAGGAAMPVSVDPQQ